MASYHITDNGPRPCSTTPDRCPYGRAGGEHYDNIAEAQNNFEQIMEKQHGLIGLAVAAKNRQSEPYKLYGKMEKLEADSEKYKKIAQMLSYTQNAPSKLNLPQYKPTGRGKSHERMRRKNVGRTIAKTINRNGRQLMKSTGPTPHNLIRLHGYLTKGLQNAVS